MNIALLLEPVSARLGSSRVPATIRFVVSLPYNETGKLLRREVKTILSS